MASGSYHGLDSEEDGGPYIIAFVPEAYEFVCSDAASQSESGKGQESSRLFHEESGVLQDQVRVTPAKPNIFSLYRYASSLDRVLTGIACLPAIAAGCGFPIMSLVFGSASETLKDTTLQGVQNLFKSKINTYVLYYVYLAIGIFFLSYTSMSLFVYTGEKVTLRAKELKQYLLTPLTVIKISVLLP
jgi:ATP-binding cassette, subfamily B (MDR/TAP), member 1